MREPSWNYLDKAHNLICFQSISKWLLPKRWWPLCAAQHEVEQSLLFTWQVYQGLIKAPSSSVAPCSRQVSFSPCWSGALCSPGEIWRGAELKGGFPPSCGARTPPETTRSLLDDGMCPAHVLHHMRRLNSFPNQAQRSLSELTAGNSHPWAGRLLGHSNTHQGKRRKQRSKKTRSSSRGRHNEILKDFCQESVSPGVQINLHITC